MNDPKDTTAGTGKSATPAPVDPKAGESKETGDPDTSKADADTVSKVDFDKAMDALSKATKRIDDLTRITGQQADEIGTLRNKTVQNFDTKAYAEQLNEDIFVNEDPLHRIKALSAFMLETMGSFEAERRATMQAHSTVVQHNPEFAEIPYATADYHAAVNNIPLSEMTSGKGMRRVLESIKTQQNANVDIDALVEAGVAKKLAELDVNKHPANKGVKPGGEKPDPNHAEGELPDEQEFNKRFAKSMGAAAFGVQSET